MYPNLFFQTLCITFSVHKFGLLLRFSNNLPDANNRPTGENSPYLVTLFPTDKGEKEAFCWLPEAFRLLFETETEKKLFITST
jgi:hypothetical protein